MQTSSQPRLLTTPFADTGSKQTVPVDSQIGITAGRASYTDGFPPLTRTPLAAGGVPPFGTDFNGVLNDITAAIRWSQAGAGYPFDSTFNTAISGYPKGARIPTSTFDGFWLNTVDGNSTNPENTTAAITGWVPSESYGVTAITGLSGSSVTLTTLQAAKARITLAGTLTANINLIVPAWVKRWEVVNNCTGAFTVTVKTPSGTGIATAIGTSMVLQGDGTNVVAATPSLALTGTPTAPTATAGTNTTQIASTAFVTTAVANATGRLIKETYFTSSGTFTPDSRTVLMLVRGVGTGGTGAGSAATTSTTVTQCGGGASAGYVEAWFTSIPSSATVTIGAVGAQVYGSGTAGGTSSFGSLISIPGGGGGTATSLASSVTYNEGGGGGRTTPTVTGNSSGFTTPGVSGWPGKVFSASASGGAGASSQFGSGGGSASTGSGGSAAGVSGGGFGAGGGGAAVSTSASATYGGTGTTGIFIVWEYM